MAEFRWYDPTAVGEPVLDDGETNRSIVAHQLRWHPAHVAFYNETGRLLRAVRNERVDDLYEFEPPPPKRCEMKFQPFPESRPLIQCTETQVYGEIHRHNYPGAGSGWERGG